MALGLYLATAALCLLVASLALDVMGFFSRKNHFDVDGKTVIITGGSQGMGRGLAKLLSQKGANVVIVARTQSKLDDALTYIASAAKNPHTQRFHSISADVTKPEENIRIIEEVTAWNNNSPPDVVWANAGQAHPHLFVDTPLETLHSQMDINYWAAAYLAHATLRSWLTPSSQTSNDNKTLTSTPARHLIMTSSVACYVGIAGYTPYAPAKAAMRSLADNLRSELNLYNGARRGKTTGSSSPAADVQVHLVVPGTIKSPGLISEDLVKHPITKKLEEGDMAQTEDEVAAAAVRRLESGGYMITTQLLGDAMRAGGLSGSPRNNWIVDTLFGWVIQVAWLFIGPDMESKVWAYGKENGAVYTEKKAEGSS